MPKSRRVLLIVLALCGFAGNSLLCRWALVDTSIDPASFTAWRLGAGALVLALLVCAAPRKAARLSGDWRGAAMLLLYAIAFSYAYVELNAGIGALLLFGAVQITMLCAGVIQGERLSVLQWAGVALACSGLLLLKLPGEQGAIGLLPAASMLTAGIAWGIYSLLGRGTASPLAATAGNFLLAAPIAIALLLFVPHPVRMPVDGIVFAVLSGALASGVGYALWYAVLPTLRSTQAALLQLLVPVLTAVAGVLLLDETADFRLLAGGGAIIAGVAMTVLLRGRANAR